MFQIRPILHHVKQYSNVSNLHLKEILRKKIAEEREIVKKFRAENGDKKIGDISLNMIYSGMRGIKGLLCETSYLDPNDGIKFRGYSIPELKSKLPRLESHQQPLPEGMFWLMLTGEIPSEPQVSLLSEELASRSHIPDYVLKMLSNLPASLHPMAQLSCAISALHHDSKFAKAYQKGIKKSQYWEYIYEDAMDLIGKITVIAAIVFNNTYGKRLQINQVDTIRDWAWNFTKMLGESPNKMADMMRLYLFLHCDHEGGNVCAHTTHLVGSALSDPYLSYSAGINGLAGPLHGLANQQSLQWLLDLRDEVGSQAENYKVMQYIEKKLDAGQVIPGYGHAVLRRTDPRFISFQKFAQIHMPNDPLFKLCTKVYQVLPTLLQERGKVSNPWPNVDAHSGVVLNHYGLNQMHFYTVLFAVSRCLGAMANLIWARALELPIERPKSYTTRELMKIVKLNKYENNIVL